MNIKKLVALTLLLLLLSGVWVVAFSSSSTTNIFSENIISRIQKQERAIYLGNSQGLHPGVLELLPDDFSPLPIENFQKETIHLSLDEILQIQNIYKVPHLEDLLAQWEKEWRKTPPVYGDNETLLSMYLTNPTTSESWQVLWSEDAKKIISLLDSVETLSNPESGMDIGVMIITPRKKYYHYIENSEELYEEEKVVDVFKPMKNRSLLAVDLFQLLDGSNIAQTEFVGYLKNQNGTLDKITLKTNDQDLSESVLRLLRKIHVQEVTFTDTMEDAWQKDLKQSGHYSLKMSLGAPYEPHETLEVSGYPFAFLTKFTRQENSMRTYQLSNSETQKLLREIAALPESTIETVSLPEKEPELLPKINFDSK